MHYRRAYNRVRVKSRERVDITPNEVAVSSLYQLADESAGSGGSRQLESKTSILKAKSIEKKTSVSYEDLMRFHLYPCRLLFKI